VGGVDPGGVSVVVAGKGAGVEGGVPTTAGRGAGVDGVDGRTGEGGVGARSVVVEGCEGEIEGEPSAGGLGESMTSGSLVSAMGSK